MILVVLMRELVDVLASFQASHLLHDLAPYLDIAVGVVLVPIITIALGSR
jgi:hypothetical protein